MTDEQRGFILAHVDRDDLDQRYGGYAIKDELLREIEAVATAQLRARVEKIVEGWWASGWGEPPDVSSLSVVARIGHDEEGYLAELQLQEPMEIITIRHTFGESIHDCEKHGCGQRPDGDD